MDCLTKEGCMDNYVALPEFFARAGWLDWSIIAIAIILTLAALGLTVLNAIFYEQGLITFYLPLFALVNLIPMIVPSSDRYIQQFILVLGSHALKDLTIDVLSAHSFSLDHFDIPSLENVPFSIPVLVSLTYQTGVVRVATVLTRAVLDQESAHCPWALLAVNFSSTMTGMVVLNLLRRRLLSLRLAACQIAVFIFTMQYTAFELAPLIPIPITEFDFIASGSLLFFYRAFTSVELFAIAITATIILRKRCICKTEPV